MRSPKTVRIVTYIVLGVTALILLALPNKGTLLRALGGGENAPEFLIVRGVVRDFVDDHPDFAVVPGNGYGHYCGNIATTLDANQKPVFVGGGHRVSREWRDANNNEIAWCMFSHSQGDSEGKFQAEPDSGGITSAETFAQWFRDAPGVNMSAIADITMNRGSDGVYSYQTNDFFPIDGRLFGDDGDDHNFHFTFELVADFVYRQSDNQMLHFMGDDDIWVFIDGRLVIDLGGIAGNVDQYIDLNRLDLVDGQTYRLHFFHAERHQPKSQWRFNSNIVFDQSRIMPSITDQFD